MTRGEWKELKRRMKRGEIVMTPTGEMRWNPYILSFNVRCRICEKAKPKNEFKGSFRVCKDCKRENGWSTKSN